MIDGRRVLAVVPARGGSKGLPLKNLQKLHGVPLVGLAGDCASYVPEIDRSVVSTDHKEIAEVARAHGLDVPFIRPEEISGDRVGDLDVLTHALHATEADDGETYNIIAMLQPTAPQREPKDVSAAIRMLVEGGWDSVWTISPIDLKNHPLKMLSYDAVSGGFDYNNQDGSKIIARQELNQLYLRNGVAYAIDRACLLEQRSIKGRNSGALVLEENFISIDTQWDLDLVEYVMRKNDTA
ncbi:MAG: N-acylneuraminate cytidylyltransferase [Alphaproteobacteria bacterium MarineAlpha4_Bin2]|nr:MAG: N-acylneuraminate cytidylyltransferase [Alphaproteobacteria bacterium MarineAlpha4_Bin2]